MRNGCWFSDAFKQPEPENRFYSVFSGEAKRERKIMNVSLIHTAYISVPKKNEKQKRSQDGYLTAVVVHILIFGQFSICSLFVAQRTIVSFSIYSEFAMSLAISVYVSLIRVLAGLKWKFLGDPRSLSCSLSRSLSLSRFRNASILVRYQVENSQSA